MTVDVLGRLRGETREEHERIEQALRLDGPLPRERYEAVLERFFGFYEPFEDALDRAGAAAVLGDWPDRRKAAWLEADLRALDRDGTDLLALPRCADLPDPCGHSRLLGCLYVLEGATLGGAVIARGVRERGGLPHRFFSNYGRDRGRRWRVFRDVLTGAVAGERATDAAVDAARAKFHAFHRWCAEATEPAERAPV